MLNLPKKVYFKRGSMNVALKELDEVYGFKRALIVSDANLYKNGIVAPVNDWILGRGIRTAEFFTIDEVPSFENVRSALPKMTEYQPDVIVAVGGGTVMSVAKAMWVLYENPEIDLADVAAKFDKITASYADFPQVGNKAKLVLCGTTVATGAQNSPFAVLADDNGQKRVIASFKLLPEISVTDAMLMDSMPAELVKKCGIAMLSQAIRAYDAPGCNEYTQGFLRETVESIVANLEAAAAGCPAALEKLANASAIGAMAIGNAVETIDVEAEGIPAASEALDDLAKHIGMDSAADLAAAYEKLAAR